MRKIIADIDARLVALKAESEALTAQRHEAANHLRETKEARRYPQRAVLITFSRFGGTIKHRRDIRARLTPTQIVVPGYGEGTERRFDRGNGSEVPRRDYLSSTYDRVDLLTDDDVAKNTGKQA